MKSNKPRIVFFYFTCLIALFPILPFLLRSIFTILWTALGLYLYLNSRKINGKKKNYKLLVITILPFLCLVLTMAYSENIERGISLLTHMLSMLVFPVVLFLNKSMFSSKQQKTIVLCFCTAVFLLVLIQISFSIYNIEYLLSDLSQHEIKINNLQKYAEIDSETINRIKIRRLRKLVIEKVDTHPTYQGLWIGFVIFLLIKEVFSKHKIVIKLFLCLITLLLFGWLLLLATRMPVLAIFVSFLMTFIIVKRYSKRVYFTASVISLLLLLSGYYFIKPFKNRIDEVYKTKFELPTKTGDIETYNSTNVRNGIYYCAIEVIKENAIFGVGVGDNQEQLNRCYVEKIGTKIYTWRNFNSHNQFLFFFISSGIIGLAIFVFSWIVFFKNAINTVHALYLFFLLLTFCISMTENILVRSDGVMFFAFFNGLFLFNKTKNDNN
ncbi:O-antigen ligase family protein [Psychroserpens sp. MEBiC05023]